MNCRCRTTVAKWRFQKFWKFDSPRRESRVTNLGFNHQGVLKPIMLKGKLANPE
ncbi:hypothetical protein CA54_55340 [Symmachiella macrocystis]|uniref:Uncharacterized protein n=1 Tax=Symmachiella macrocystis TaxID=2527985 RepID=A0A5C6B709_9PLAN|nr:hypothetical protein CA54_55340 [Symmachiella macrocystis]